MIFPIWTIILRTSFLFGIFQFRRYKVTTGMSTAYVDKVYILWMPIFYKRYL